MKNEQYQYASFLLRIFSMIMDGIFLFIIAMIFMKYANSEQLDWISNNVELFQILSCIFITLYMLLFLLTMGGTPAKIGLNIKIIDAKTGEKLAFKKTIIRYILSFISSGVFFIGYIWILFDKKNQSLHDKIVGSYVIKSKYSK